MAKTRSQKIFAFFPLPSYLPIVLLLGFLTACSGDKSLEGLFSPDPKLKETPIVSPTGSGDLQTQLLSIFPSDIPRYPDAQLVDIEAGSTSQQGKTLWTSPDPSNLIETYYQKSFESNQWEIIQPFSLDTNGINQPLIARRNTLQVTISLESVSGSKTDFAIAYQLNADVVTSPTVSPPQTPTPSVSPTVFSDLATVAEPIRRYIQDLATLGVLNATSNGSFQPNQPITRRDYARWLVNTNNKLFTHLPSQQIHLASATTQPTFQDIPANDPDFPVIQGLAEAGFIPSPLRGDSTAILFRPNVPLTREDLMLWKVSLDLRKGLPNASLDTLKETWGFQDAAKINPKAWGALLADFQNGEQSNIRRIFGSTILFQPKKTVTRAEAAATLWYFGSQGDGISAADVLQGKVQPTPTITPSPTLTPTTSPSIP
jgi:hypothetical protein